MGARLLMDRAHEYDRLDEAFLADLRLILIATYLKNTAKICTKISLSGEVHNHVLKNRTSRIKCKSGTSTAPKIINLT